MISVDDAINKIRSATNLLAPVRLPLAQASGFVLAEDVFAECSVPNFNQSAMDGYAFRYDDLHKTNELHVSHEIAAGDASQIATPEYNAVRIFTGAAVPKELDTVVMQEKIAISGNKIVVLDKELKKGSNVRLAGAEIKKGDLALKKNTVLSPAAIGFLAGVGKQEVEVYPKPVVHIIVTGKELIKAGQALKEGQVYESNSLLLQTALKQLHIDNISIDFIGDDLNETVNALSKALISADLILITGGVSVGNYDFVVKAAEACGIEQLFHKVKQRPGKPLYGGTKNNKIVFGLPGNPASVLSCFYNFVVKAIECMTGQKNLIQKKWFPLSTPFSKKISLTQFLKAVYNDEKVTPLPAQESFRLSSFSIANCLIILPEEKMDFAEGEMVETLVLPYL
jgi:molybdopterin molybdotransferase